MSTEKKVENWYNNFASQQIQTGITIRHYKILEYLRLAGLRKNSRVLEIGCGVGTLTELLSQYITKGSLVAVDISSESVEIARKRLSKAKNLEFVVSDIYEFNYPEKFDFIVLPDVLEHVPVEQHRRVFQILSAHMHDQSVLFIHIPHPKALDYIRLHTPEKLQIIDQSLDASTLIENAHANKLVLVNYTPTKLHHTVADYVYMVFRKDYQVNLITLSKLKIIKAKTISRIKFTLSKWIGQ